jgi:hypothetical protein
VRRRPSETPQDAGRRFESLWAKLFGVKPQRGSGNQWFAKLDVFDGTITFSCKFTSHRSYSVSKKLLRECEEAVYKNGDNSIPGIAIALDDGSDVVVVLKAADFVRLMSLESAKYIVPSKSEQKRRISRIPSLLREDVPDA